MTSDPHVTTMLLERARENDREALNDLLAHVMPRIEAWVRKTRGRAVAGKFDTLDCTQDVAMNLVQYLPTVVVRDSDMFHGLLYRMIVNSLKNKYEYLMARRRRLTRERPLTLETGIDLEPADPAESPSEVAVRGERQAWLRFSLALLPAEDQELIFRHHYDGELFVDLAEKAGLAPDAIRMRFNRAMTKLNSIMGKLRRGETATVVADLGDDD